MSKSLTMKKVVHVCNKQLMNNYSVLDYLYDRGFTNETINMFHIGLFPDKPNKLFQEISAKDLREAGIVRNATSSVFTKWNLIMPVYDVYNNVVAIAGRTLLSEKERKKQGISKYMNTVYAKSHHLFGLSFAKKEILKTGSVYVVEGYMDVMSSHQVGFKNVVGCCGTLFSNRQMSLLARYTNNIILMFDNDSAGKKAMSKHVKQKQCNDISISSIEPFISSGVKDVDEYLQKYPIQDLMNLLKQNDGYNIAPLW